MNVVLNFSHRLSETAKGQIAEKIGDFVEVVQPCQLDLTQPLRPQLEAIVEEGMLKVGEVVGNVAYTDYNGSAVEPEPVGTAHYPVPLPAYPDYIIPPALSYAAAYVGAVFASAQSDAVAPSPAPMIILRREGIPPEYVLAEILQ